MGPTEEDYAVHFVGVMRQHDHMSVAPKGTLVSMTLFSQVSVEVTDPTGLKL